MANSTCACLAEYSPSVLVSSLVMTNCEMSVRLHNRSEMTCLACSTAPLGSLQVKIRIFLHTLANNKEISSTAEVRSHPKKRKYARLILTRANLSSFDSLRVRVQVEIDSKLHKMFTGWFINQLETASVTNYLRTRVIQLGHFFHSQFSVNISGKHKML